MCCHTCLRKKNYLEIMNNQRKVTFLLLILSVTGMLFLDVIITNKTWIDLPKTDTRDNVNITKTTRAEKLEISQNFVAVTQNRDTIIYSAYAEELEELHIIRIIGVTENRNRSINKETFRCHLRYRDEHTSVTTTNIVEGFIENIPEDHDLKYTAAYFICPLHRLPIPDSVSVTFANDTDPVGYIPVTNITNRNTPYTFTVCLSPLHSGYNDSSQLLEWIELNRILGVEKFNVYVYNVTNEILKILKHYEDDDIVEILPWSIPSHLCTFDGSPPLLHSCGQLVALNDCLYRTKGRSKFIAVLDLDEFIIPQNKDDVTWSDMIRRLPVDSGYLFLSSFISASTAEERQNYLKTNLRTMSYITRDNVVFQGRVRSKIIARTNEAKTLGVHHVWSFTSGRERGVFPSEGLLYHYRDTPVTYPEGMPVSRFKTYATLKYYNELHQRVLTMQNKIV